MSETFTARLYTGQSSGSRDVTILVDDEGYLAPNGEGTERIHFGSARLSPRIGDSARFIVLPNGDRLETRANDAVDRLAQRWIDGHSTLAHRLERSRRFIVLTAVILLAGSYLFVVYGVPALSRFVTGMLPVSLDDQLGAEVFEQFDEVFFEPTRLSEDRQVELSALFASLTPDNQRDYRIEFRDSPLIGANAFALPNAQIVFADQLIELSEDDVMLASIMLHEIGHIQHRHSMQAVVRQAGISMLVFVLTGDVNSSATTLITLLPTFLMQSSYSRSLEWEADTYALEQMLARGMDPGRFADIMERMISAQDDARTASAGDDPVLEYFSTHPASQRRIDRFRAASL